MRARRRPTTLQKYPDARNKGSVVVKFSPDGKVLMRLGTPGVRGNPPAALADPTAVITDPANGDVYVAESHMDVSDPNLIARISVFDKNGKFLRSFGKAGTGPGEFRTPHALAFDSHGNLVVADRHNHRVQLMTKSGEFLREYTNFSRVSGLVVDANDVLYATDSESTEAVHPGWSRGLRIGSLARRPRDDVHPAAQDELARRRDGRGHRARSERQSLHRRVHRARRHEVREGATP